MLHVEKVEVGNHRECHEEKALDDDFQGKFQVAPSQFGEAILLVQEGSTVHWEHIAGLEEPNK